MLFVSLRSMRPCYLVLLVLVGLGVTGCNESNVNSSADAKKAVEGTQRFIFITNGDDPYFDVLNAGLQVGNSSRKQM